MVQNHLALFPFFSPMEELQARVSRYLKSKVSDPHLVSDLTQEVILRLLDYEKKSVIKNREAFCIRIAGNLLTDHFRRNQQVLPLHFHEQDTSNQFFLEQMMDCQTRYIEELDEKSRFLIQQVDIENVSQKVLASEMNVPYPSLKSNVQRARKLIREKFDSECIIERDASGRVISCQRR